MIMIPNLYPSVNIYATLFLKIMEETLFCTSSSYNSFLNTYKNTVILKYKEYLFRFYPLPS